MLDSKESEDLMKKIMQKSRESMDSVIAKALGGVDEGR